MKLLVYRAKDGSWQVPFVVPVNELDNLVAAQDILARNYDMTGYRLYQVGSFDAGKLTSQRKVLWRCK